VEDLITPLSLSLLITALGVIIYLTRDYLNRVFGQSWELQEVSIGSMMKHIKSGKWRYTNFLGISSKEGGFAVSGKVFTNPGLMVVGTQGSGKTVTMMTSLVVEQLVRGDMAVEFLIDISPKGMGDFSFLFNEDNVITSILDIKKLIPTFDILRQELNRRGRIFSILGISEIVDYEEKMKDWIKRYEKIIAQRDNLSQEDLDFLLTTAKYDVLNFKNPIFNSNLQKFASGKSLSDDEFSTIDIKKEFKPLAFITIAFEEYHAISTNESLDFYQNKGDPSTVAGTLFQLARTGRSAGFQIFISTQRGGSAEIQSDIKAGVVNALAHRVGSAQDASSMNLEIAADIPLKIDGVPTNGRSYRRVDSGVDTMQCPFINKKDMISLISNHKPKFKAELLSFDIETAKEVCGSSDMMGFLKNGKIDLAVKEYKVWSKLELAVIVQRIIEVFGFEVEPLDNPEDEINAVATNKKTGKRYGVLIGTSGGYGSDSISQQKIKTFINELDLYNCEGAISVSFGSSRIGEGTIREKNGISLCYEDLDKISRVLASKEKSTPEEFEKRFHRLPMAIFANSENESITPQKDDDDGGKSLDDIINQLGESDEFDYEEDESDD